MASPRRASCIWSESCWALSAMLSSSTRSLVVRMMANWRKTPVRMKPSTRAEASVTLKTFWLTENFMAGRKKGSEADGEAGEDVEVIGGAREADIGAAVDLHVLADAVGQ